MILKVGGGVDAEPRRRRCYTCPCWHSKHGHAGAQERSGFKTDRQKILLRNSPLLTETNIVRLGITGHDYGSSWRGLLRGLSEYTSPANTCGTMKQPLKSVCYQSRFDV